MKGSTIPILSLHVTLSVKKNESQSLDDVVGYRLGDPVNPFANGRVIKKLTN
jgi:hypothetical protein